MGERMLRNMAKHPGFAVVAAWDPAPGAAEKLYAIAPQARFAADATALAAAPDIDCVYIATPPASHLDYAAIAFDHGKAVFCEKPLAIDRAAGLALVTRVERDRLIAAVNFPFASAPAVRAIASGLKSGELGGVERVGIEIAFAAWPRPWQASARWLMLREQGGFVREVVSHFIFLTQRLLGPIQIDECHVDYPTDGRSAETSITARLQAGQIPVSLTGRVGGESEDFNRWRLDGREGAFELHDWYSLRRRINGGWLDIDFGDTPIRELSYRAQLGSLSAMLSGRPNPLPSFREGLAVQECVEAMLARGLSG